MAAVGAAVLAASCCGTSETTKITGTIAAVEGLDEVNVILEDYGIDTLLTVTDGKFSVEVPTDVTVTGLVAAGPYQARFIPDGTKLKVVLGPESSVKSSPNSVNARFVEFSERSIAFQENFMTEVQNIQAKTLRTATIS